MHGVRGVSAAVHGGRGTSPGGPRGRRRPRASSLREREFFIGKFLVRMHFIIVMIEWNGLSPCQFDCPFPSRDFDEESPKKRAQWSPRSFSWVTTCVIPQSCGDTIPCRITGLCKVILVILHGVASPEILMEKAHEEGGDHVTPSPQPITCCGLWP